MAELFPTEPQLFEVYGATFDALTRCLLISVAALFVVSVILVALFCVEELRRHPSARRGESAPKSWLGPSALILWLSGALPPGLTQGSEVFPPRVPLGLDEFIPVPDDNPSTPEKIELGRQLFFDKQLSRDGTVACATCHLPERAFTDARPVAIGIENRPGRRNAPSLLNRAYGKALFWVDRVKSLDEQPLIAITNRHEMDLTLPELDLRLKRNTDYSAAFVAAFPKDRMRPMPLERSPRSRAHCSRAIRPLIVSSTEIRMLSQTPASAACRSSEAKATASLATADRCFPTRNSITPESVGAKSRRISVASK
jgi:hypothetical protein